MPVLIVDDEPQVRQLVSFLLVEHGLETIEAPDGPSALSVVRANTSGVSALLTDIRMPGMSGVDLAKAVTAEVAHMPVLFISSEETSEAELSRTVPGCAFIQKPFHPAALIQAVKNLLAFRH